MTSNKMSELSKEETEQMRKLAHETLGWKPEETHFPLEAGCLEFAQPSEFEWKRPWTGELRPIRASLAVQSSQTLPVIVAGGGGGSKELQFPQDAACVKDANLVLFEQKSNAASQSLARDPLPLERCIICCDPEWEDIFEIQEFVNKESFVFKGANAETSKMWFQAIQFYTQSLGGWRKRRKGLGNIMVDPKMVAADSGCSDPDAEPVGSAAGASGLDPGAGTSSSAE